MTPQDYIKQEILLKCASWNVFDDPKYTPVTEQDIKNFTAEQINDLYNKVVENDDHWDAESETRCGYDEETDIPSDYSRHYESKSVAMQCHDGKWVGWTYWNGGGKHGEPSAVEWIEYAYFVSCEEEEKLVIIRTFSKE